MRRPTTRILLALAGVVAVICVFGAGWGLLRLAQAAPTLTTDKGDYFADETVIITGGGFAHDTLYYIPVIRPDGSTVTGDGSNTSGWDSVQSNVSGGFTYSYQLDGLPGTYEVRAYPSDWDGNLSQTPVATVAFTDGNVKVYAAPSGVTFTLTATGFLGKDNSNCTGTETTSGKFGTFDHWPDVWHSFGIGNTESVKLQAAATSDQGGAFINWTSSDPFTPLGEGAICVTGFNGEGGREYYANYGGAPTPTPTETPVTPSPTPTETPVTPSPTPTATNTPVTPTNTPTPTATNTPVTPTNTPTPTATNTPVTPTRTPTPTNTPVTPIPPTPTSTGTPIHPPGVGGTVMLPPAAVAAESGSTTEGSGCSAATYVALAAGVAMAIGIGGWYARRRRRAG